MYDTELGLSVTKIAVMGFGAFILAFLLTPALTHVLYTKKLWRKTVRTQALGGGEMPFFKKFHSEGEVSTPRFGGMLIWLVPPFLAGIFFLLAQSGNQILEEFNFLSRGQTWLPIVTLLAASSVGFADDALQVIRPSTGGIWNKIWRKLGNHFAGGLSFKHRFGLISLIGLVGAWWFYSKLGIDVIHIPGIGEVPLGIFFIPFFLLVMLATYSGGVIDGIDGLAGGAFVYIFGAYGIISFIQGQIDLAAFCFAIVGALLAFLWFNIPPARFYMGEVGIMGLTATLTVVAFLTDAVSVLPIIAFLLVIESASVIIQVLSKKLRDGKKVFLAAPIHHHFEAKGWPSYKITMRFWVIGMVMAIIGVAIQLLG